MVSHPFKHMVDSVNFGINEAPTIFTNTIVINLLNHIISRGAFETAVLNSAVKKHSDAVVPTGKGRLCFHHA